MELKTPLYECHHAAGGNIVPFAGYLLPMHYGTGIIAEHLAVRNQAGLFDVSHMGEVILSGPNAGACVDYLLCNDMTTLKVGRVRYSPMLNENGGVVDDLIVYRLAEDRYMLVVNASNCAKDIAWMQAHLLDDVHFEDISGQTAEIALQGPNSREILAKLIDPALIPSRYYSFTDNVSIAGVNCLVSQTGYTGETGYEFYLDNSGAVALWQALLEAGQSLGLIPCGLGARDTLRLEAGMPLYGHEMTDDITPLEASLGFAVKLDRGNFVGRQALIEAGDPKVTSVGLKVIGRGIIREHAEVYRHGQCIGHTTSGTHAPYLGYGIAMATVACEEAVIGNTVDVLVRGRHVSAEIVPMPFFSHA